MEPGTRIRFSTPETISNVAKNPSVKFSQKMDSDGKLRPIVTIEFALIGIAEIIPDTGAAGDKTVFCDALIDSTNYLVPKKATVEFKPNTNDGESIMELRAELSTKIPGTGSDLFESALNEASKIQGDIKICLVQL